jgi:hypothetical protein
MVGQDNGGPGLEHHLTVFVDAELFLKRLDVGDLQKKGTEFVREYKK